MKKIAKFLTFWILNKELRRKVRNNIVRVLSEKFIPIEENWIVFYDTFSKSGNGDSVYPVAQKIREQYPNMKFYFVAKEDKSIEMADEVLVIGTKRFDEVLLRAKYIVSPMELPEVKRKEQIWLMLWHGTPIKKLYLSREPENKNFQKNVENYKNLDFFCIQSEISKFHLMEAFNLPENCFASTGYPRNDMLLKNNEIFSKTLKDKLNLPLDKKVILYCPTWRRYDFKAVLPFDLIKLKKALGNEYVMLIRSHVGKHAWVDENNNAVNIFDNEFSFDGGKYPEISHLYLISDMLISDYSSCIFDFSLLRKPQVLYTYDEEEYKKEFDLYYDYNSFAPFPVAKTSEELITAITNYPNLGEKYDEFAQKYLCYDNGNASQKVVDLLFKKSNN